jgi:RNA polymerase sigma-70 factor (ECF subfamily)
MIPSDEELMLKVKFDNDTSAFESLVQRYKIALLNFVYRFIGDQETAQDLSQDVFIRLWMSAETYLPVAKFATFLYTIAKNVCLNALAKLKSTPQMQSLSEVIASQDGDDCELLDALSDPNNSPEKELLGMELEQRITKAIGKLSPEHRLVFILTEYDDLSYQDVAAIIQCPVGTVASRKNAAVKTLRRYLEPLREGGM